jgi:phenol 2-monooxygenase
MSSVPTTLVRHWSQAFIDDLAVSAEDGGGSLFESYKLTSQGCVIMIRPDGYVGTIMPLGGREFVQHLKFYIRVSCQFYGSRARL